MLSQLGLGKYLRGFHMLSQLGLGKIFKRGSYAITARAR